MPFPIIQFSGLYYPQTFVDLVLWKRANVPELTDEDPHEPSMQMLSAYALGFHYNNILLDFVANETLFATAVLRESMRSHLLLIGRRLLEATAASTDLLFTMSSPLTSTVTIPGRLRAGTQPTLTSPEVVFETPAAEVEVLATNIVSQAWVYDKTLDAYTDATAIANGGAGTYTWTGAGETDDAIYWGHRDVTFDRIELDPLVPGDFWDSVDHRVWEYYDGNLNAAVAPTAVAPGAGVLAVNCNTLLGVNDRSGTIVRVLSQTTGAYEDIAVAYSGGINLIVTVGELNQPVPSAAASNYLISSNWRELPDVVETLDGVVATATWTLPEDLLRSWRSVEVNSVEGFYVRLRATSGTHASDPTFGQVIIDEGFQYIRMLGSQGSTIVENPVGTSDGSATQQFVSSSDRIIEGTSIVEVDEGGGFLTYRIVFDFLASGPNSRDVLLEFDVDSRAVVTFGDGTAGYIPTTLSPVRLTYRIGAQLDGNVGANTVVVSRGGNLFVSAVTNPRGAIGWNAPEGTSPASLETLRIEGPASLRTLGRAFTDDDIESLALAFISSDGSQPVGRALAIEEGFGAKTIKLVLVSKSGAAISSDVLTEIDTYFNGDVIEGVAGILVINYQLTAVNFVAVPVDVTATVLGGTEATIVAALTNFLSPLAEKASGAYEHVFDDIIYTSRFIAEIFESDEDVENVPTLTLPAADIVLTGEELPVPGTFTITVI